MDDKLDVLQAELATAYSQFAQAARDIHPAHRQQTGVCGDWSPQEVVAHLAGWDAALLTFIKDPDRFDPPTDVDVFNEKSVSARQHLTWDERVAELDTGFQDLQEAVATVTKGMKIFRRVSGWLQGRRADYDLHAGQLKAWEA